MNFYDALCLCVSEINYITNLEVPGAEIHFVVHKSPDGRYLTVQDKSGATLCRVGGESNEKVALREIMINLITQSPCVRVAEGKEHMSLMEYAEYLKNVK